MMQLMMGQRGTRQPATVTEKGTRAIAGYQAVCYRVGGSREICISQKLMDEVAQEMGAGRFSQALGMFSRSGANNGGPNPEAEALARLYERGFPMSDMQQAAAIPGINASMLQLLPEAQRAQLMQQFGGPTGGANMQGSKVIRVERNASMPQVDLSAYPRRGFQQYMQENLRMGGMRRRQ